MTKLRNIFDLPVLKPSDELFDVLVQGDTQIERIISTGRTTPADEWYDQDLDEWVILLDGEAHLYFEETGEIVMKKGDYILIKAHEKHRVTYTSSQPPCVWLAVHGKLSLSV